MTLALELETIEQLADPAAVVEDAHEWSTYVGLVSDEPAYFVKEYVSKLDPPNGRLYYTWLSKRKSLSSIQQEFDTDRHVFVGTTPAAVEISEELDWEYLPLEDAAEKAGWDLAEPEQEHTAADTV